jgi:hypothetical protein
MNMANESKQRKTRQLTEFPEGWALGEPEIATFRKYNPTASDADIALQWDKFEAHHQALGSQFKLWSKAWLTWAINQKIYGFKPAPISIGFIPPTRDVPNFGKTGMANLARHLGRGK